MFGSYVAARTWIHSNRGRQPIGTNNGDYADYMAYNLIKDGVNEADEYFYFDDFTLMLTKSVDVDYENATTEFLLPVSCELRSAEEEVCSSW